MGKLLWSYGARGAEISAVVAVVGTTIAKWLGGWDSMIGALVVAMGVDILLGLLCGIKSKTLDSQVMLWGGINKVLVLVFVWFGVVLDGALGLPEPYIRTMVICFYLGREGLSVIENSGKLGVPWPKFLAGLLEQLKDKGDNGKDGE